MVRHTCKGQTIILDILQEMGWVEDSWLRAAAKSEQAWPDIFWKLL